MAAAVSFPFIVMWWLNETVTSMNVFAIAVPILVLITHQKNIGRIIKGTESQLEVLLNAASWTKEMKFHIYIVQPSLQKDNASTPILLLLGNTYHYLRTICDVELKVYTS